MAVDPHKVVALGEFASQRHTDAADSGFASSSPGGLHETLDLGAIVAELRKTRERWRSAQQRPREVGGRELPSREVLTAIVDGLRGALFPMRLGPPDLRQESEDYFVGHTLDAVLGALLGQVRLELRYQARHAADVEAQRV